MQEKKRPFIGIAVIIKNNHGEILLGKRINSHGNNCWQFPGGHLEFGETFQQTAIREVYEETGLVIDNPIFVDFTNNIFPEDKHYITMFFTCKISSGSPKVMEPHKCSEWRWCNPNNLPVPLFFPITNLIKNKKNIARI